MAKATPKAGKLSEKEILQIQNADKIELSQRITYLEDRLKKTSTTLKRVEKDAAITQQLVQAIRSRSDVLRPVTPVKLKDNKSTDAETMILLLSDIHGGEKIDAEELGGINAYDLSVMERRTMKLRDKTARIHEILSNSYKFPELKVYGLGDFISGIIHDELVESADGNIIDWLFQTSEVVADLLLSLSARFEKTTFIGVVGNHGRMHKKPRYKNKYVNWDYLCYDRIRQLCNKDEKIKFIIPKSFFYMDKVAGKNILLMHGDNIKSWAGIPWYGIQREIARFKDLMARQKKFIDYVMMAHFHNTGMLQTTTGEVILNGSLIGGNEYSVGAIGAASDPFQLLFGMHKKRGITFRYNLGVKDA